MGKGKRHCGFGCGVRKTYPLGAHAPKDYKPLRPLLGEIPKQGASKLNNTMNKKEFQDLVGEDPEDVLGSDWENIIQEITD